MDIPHKFCTQRLIPPKSMLFLTYYNYTTEYDRRNSIAGILHLIWNIDLNDTKNKKAIINPDPGKVMKNEDKEPNVVNFHVKITWALGSQL